MRTHGEVRGRSPRSWRRSRTTVRRSCTVTAKRSCDTRSARRVSCSSRRRSASSSASAATIEDGGDGEQVDRVGAHAPHRQAAEPVAGSRPAPRDRRRLGGEQHGGERRGDPARECRGHERRRRRRRRRGRRAPRQPRTGGPRRRRAGQPARGELSGDRPDHRAGERHRPHPLADRAQQHLAARDRGEQQVAGIAALQRDRPAVAATAQPDGDGGDGDEADHRGSARRRPRRAGSPSPARR